MLVDVFTSNSEPVAVPFAITKNGKEQGQNVGFMETRNGVIVFAFIYVGF